MIDTTSSETDILPKALATRVVSHSSLKRETQKSYVYDIWLQCFNEMCGKFELTGNMNAWPHWFWFISTRACRCGQETFIDAQVRKTAAKCTLKQRLQEPSSALIPHMQVFRPSFLVFLSAMPKRKVASAQRVSRRTTTSRFLMCVIASWSTNKKQGSSTSLGSLRAHLHGHETCCPQRDGFLLKW